MSPIITAISLTIGWFMHVRENVYEDVPNGTLLIFWVLSIISNSMKVFHIFVHSYFRTDLTYSILYTFALVLSFFIFFLQYIPFNFFLKPRQYESIPSEEKPLLENADIFSRFAFTWINPLITKATNSEINPTDLPSIQSNLSGRYLGQAFKTRWEKRTSDSVGQLVFVLLKAFGYLIFYSGVYEFIIDVFALAQPFLLRYLIIFAQSYRTDDPLPISIGFYISLGMFSVAIFRTFFRTILFQVVLGIMLSVRGSLYVSIYDKSVKLSAKSRHTRSTGEIVNLMSTDIVIIARTANNISSLWQAPIKIMLCIAGLYQLLGKSAFVAPLIILAVMPLNSYMSSQMKKMRRKQMKFKDERIRLTTEILTNIKSLKLYGWEPALIERLKHIRNNKQLRNLRNMILFSSSIDFLWVIVPCFITTLSFASFALLEKKPLTPELVFPCLSLFTMMNGPILDFPRTIVTIINSFVSFQRTRDFLVSDELQSNAVNKVDPTNVYGDDTVIVRNANFAWSNEDTEPTALKDISYVARKGELSCIVGKVGSGKTSFLKALLGELYLQSGSVTMKGSVAYVSQDMWLTNSTLRENILFGHRYDPVFYELTLEACALKPDIELLPDGDQTEIGEMGITLSGGQKARVSFARAVYARADIYLLDDPLSAVDEHVATHIMENVLSSDGILASKTRVFATNSIHALSKADSIVLLENQRIVERSTYQEALESNGELGALIAEFGRHNNPEPSTPDASSSSFSSSSTIGEMINAEETAEDAESLSKDLTDLDEAYIKNRRHESVVTVRRASVATFKEAFRGRDLNQKAKRTEKTVEKAEMGHVKFNVYKKYIQSCGVFSVVVTIFIVIISSMDSFTAKFWLKHWSEQNTEEGGNVNLAFYLGVYLGIGITFAVLGVARRAVVRIYCGLTASKKLHNEMVESVTKSPMQFFETTPMGRILNRFSGDIAELDESLPSNFLEIIWVITDMIISICVIVFASPFVLVILFPLIIVYSYYQKYYASASRALKRILMMSQSPIYSHFQETLTGAVTIRAFDQVDRFEFISYTNIDYNLRAGYLYRGVSRWLSMRQQVIGSLLSFATAILVSYGAVKQTISPGLIGLVMGYSSLLAEDVNYFIKMLVSLETSVIAVERILEFCKLKSEAPSHIPENTPDPSWPSAGAIKFEHYSTKYRENLDLILNDINLDIKPREKIGVVGRTGAGKSSLIMSLFRIIEPTDGRILIDNVDITKIGLADLRSHLSIIPQDSQIFEGTVRQNLDPLNEHSDERIWEVLKHSHLSDFISSLDGQLDAVLSEGGSNFSNGQRQLMCLGRALLHDSPILVLDEATASVDVSTDKLIQETIRTEFKNKTIVTIAHRLNTILDSDRVLVLDKGQVAEFDTPEKLLQNPDSLFYALCKKGGFVP